MILPTDEDFEACGFCGLIDCPNNCAEKHKGKTFSGFDFCKHCAKLERFCKCEKFEAIGEDRDGAGKG